jgi:hypothetical protein
MNAYQPWVRHGYRRIQPAWRMTFIFVWQDEPLAKVKRLSMKGKTAWQMV